MGNSIGGRRNKKAKVMKIDGETFKLKTPVQARHVVRDYPGHVLLESAAVKRLGLRARPLDPDEDLQPKKLYFLVDLPKPDANIAATAAAPRRVRSNGVHLSAKDRLDLLMLSRRAVSDVTAMRPADAAASETPVRLKMRLPKAQVERLVAESGDGAEVAQKIVNLYISGEDGGGGGGGDGPWKPELGSIGVQRPKGVREVRFR